MNDTVGQAIEDKPFEVIDETLYGKKKFKTAREKISWVCENFDGAEERLKPSLGKEGPEC